MSRRASRRRRAATAGLTALLGLGLLSATVAGQIPTEEAYAYFGRNCVSCHTIGGGPLAGPDLAGVLERRDRAWLTAFLLDPRGVIDGGDPYAQALLREARGVYMPTPPGITRDLAGKLLDVLEVESGLETSRFKGVQVPDRPLTAEDVARGRRLFEGRAAFAGGAPACFACHTVEGAPGFGGGRLGPDLTTVYARLEGRKALAAWLAAPPSPVMAPVFQDAALDGEEILALTAYLAHTSGSGAEQAHSAVPAFLLTGLGLAAAVLVLLDLAWKDRYVATRRPLVERQAARHRAPRSAESMEIAP